MIYNIYFIEMLASHRVSCDFSFLEICADNVCKTETFSEMKSVAGFIFVLHIPLAETIKEFDNFIRKGLDL